MQQNSGGRREPAAAAAGGSAAASGGGTSSAMPRAGSGASTARQRGAARPAARPGASAGGGLQPLQQKLQQHIDREDRRIKELTEGILYEFFPATLHAVLPPGADPAAGLSAGAARAVAGAALTVATLMNAPPGFLEFLLCVPWADLGPLYPRAGREEGGDAPAVPQLLTSQAERAALVNVRLDPALMDCVLDFLYREQHRESLPPMIRLAVPAGSHDPEVKSVADLAGVTREAVAALLDGATPLHCAAIRGNPAQVDHLLLCGADPLLTNAAGELPLEVVPVCGDRCLGNGKLSCRCMGPRDQEAWECRSRLARTLILRRCVVQFRNGLSAWLRMALLCLMCLLGFWGNHTTLRRTAIEQHAARRAEARRRRLLQQTQATLLKMRTNAASGRQALDGGDAGGGGSRSGAKVAASEPPDPHEQQLPGGDSSSSADPPGGSDSYVCSGAAAPGAAGQQSPEDYAYACYSQAVQLLKELDLRPGSIPAGFLEAGGPEEEPPGGPSARVFPDEQAAIHCGWAEAALRKARACGCAGCAALAMHAVAAGQRHVAALLASPELAQGRDGGRVARVGAAMARLVHCKAALLLLSDVRQSATRAAVWRAQQCLQEWERLRLLGMTAGLGEDDCLDLQCLEAWCRAASADLLLLEALAGAPLAPLQPLGEALGEAVSVDPSTGVPTLLRPVGRDAVRQLASALAAAEPHASEHIARVAEAVAGSLQAEISAGDRLRDLLQPRSGGMNVDDLTAAIRAAERYPSLEQEVAQARALKERWIRRAQAQAQFDAAVESLSGPASQSLLSTRPGAPPAIDAEAFWSELNSRLQRLEAATEGARHANIGVARARRVLKELQAQGAAVEAAARLDEALGQPRCTSAALRAALAKAEAAAAAAAPGACQFAVGAELLLPRIQAAKQKLEVERAAEGLSRAAATCKAVSDLPRLEAAILAARKVGAQELDPEAYRAASEMRLRLDGASRARGALEAALRSLQKMGRQDDADAVERCIEEAEQLGELLLPETARAREAVQRWRAAAAAEARLTRALRDGVGTAHLSRAIKEAAAAGVKVGEARRLLKLMQALEAAMQQASEGPLQYQALKSKIEQAEAGGCPEGMVADAKRQLHRLLLAEVRAELDAALKLSRAAERSVAQRLSTLKAVLDKADVVLAMDEELQEQERQQAAAAAAAVASRAGGSDAAPSEASDDVPASAFDNRQGRAGPRQLQRSDTGLSSGSVGAPPHARGEPGSSGGLPPGISGASRLESFASDSGSPLSAASAAAAAAVAVAEGAGPPMVPPSVYVSAAPSVQLEPASSDDADVAVLLEATSGDAVQLSILLPAAAEAEGEAGGEGEAAESESEGELPPELAGDELAVVRHMARQARRLLAKEEAEQARIERERQEEARLRREQQQREKAERERADRERAEKARAERAERKAALEQQKAERRERERQQRLERERQRQEREKLAKEHFALLQKQRRLLAQAQPPAAPLPDLTALPLGPPAPGLLPQTAAQQAAQHTLSVGGAGLFSLPAGAQRAGSTGLAAGLGQNAAALELWAAGGPAGAAGADFSGLPGLLQHAQHDRSDSLELLSEQQGLLELLNDQTPTAGAAAAAAAAAPFGSGPPEAADAAAGGAAAADALQSPTATAASDGWEGPAAAAAAAGLGGSSLAPPALGSGRWSSVEGSIEGAPGPEPALSPEPSPLKQHSLPAAAGGAGAGAAAFLPFEGGLWMGGGGAGSGMGGAANRASWSSLDPPSLGGSHALGQPGAASSAGLLWGSSGNLAAAAGGVRTSPSKLSVQDDLALTGLGSRLWQSGTSGSGDGWAEVLGGAVQQGGSLLASPQQLPPAGGTAPGGPQGNPALALLQQRRQQQLIAALDAAKARLTVQQRQPVAVQLVHQQQQQQQQQQQRPLCKFFVHGFCREGDSCRFSHTLPSAGADAQHPQRLLGLQRLSGGAPTPPAAPQQQPGAGGVLSFGAPGAAAFAGSGAPGSAPASRAGTPDMRLGGVAAPGPGGEAQGAAIPASSSGFSVNAPSFSPREPLSSSSSNAAAAAAAAGGLLPGAASLPAFAGLGAPLALDSFAGGRYSRPGSAVNSAFATPRDDLHLSAEAESFHDVHAGGDERDQPARDSGGGYGGHHPRGIGAYQAYSGGFGGGGGGGGGEPEEGGELYADVEEAGQQDSLGLPSEASLFHDLPAFLKDTTDE